MFRLILLDRDGVINEDSPDYIKSVDEWRPIPGSLEAIAALRHSDRPVGVCTNQSGIGRGIVSRQAVLDIHETMHLALKGQGADLSAIIFCPHHPDEGCACRKPAPGMLLRLMQALQVSSSQTCYVGDSMTDLQAAQQAGVQPILVRTGNGEETEQALLDGQVPALDGPQSSPVGQARVPMVFDNLSAVVAEILSDNLAESAST